MKKATFAFGLLVVLLAASMVAAGGWTDTGAWKGYKAPGSPYDPSNVAITGGYATGLSTVTTTNATATTLTVTTLNAPRYVSLQVEPYDTAATAGTIKAAFPVPGDLAGYTLADAEARVYTAGVTGALDLSLVKRDTAGAEATAYTLEVTSGVVDASTGQGAAADRTVAAGDLILVNVTAIHSGTASSGLWVVMRFDP